MSPARNLSFIIPGRIGGKGRPRAFLRGGKIGMHTPAKTASDEGVVRQFAALAMAGSMAHHSLLLNGPLMLSILVARQYPKSWGPKKRTTKFITGKPDCDNVVKLIADAMNGIAYRDDSQIAQIHIQRVYRSDPECVQVHVRELE